MAVIGGRIGEVQGENEGPFYTITVLVPVRAGEPLLLDLSAAVGDAVHQFVEAVPDKDWYYQVLGHWPPEHPQPE